MRVLLTGGAGLIGNALGQRLVSEGHQVRVLTRSPSDARARLSFPCELVVWGETTDPPAAIFEDIDAVAHLAGASIADGRWTESRKQELVASRAATARSLARAAAGRRVSVFVSASGIGYYGDRGTEELTEASAPGGDFLARLCGDWERAAEAFPAHRIARLRFGVVLSPTGGFLRRIAPMMLRFGASQLGGGGQYLSWIHVDDAANAILYALERPEARGAYNVTAPQPVTNAAMTAALSDIFGGPHMPAAPALALRALYGELADLLLGSQRGLPARLLAEGFTFAHPEFAAAARAVYPGLGPGEMQVHREQWLPLAPDALWAFFTSEQNLEKITPPFLNFHVVGKSTPQIERGTTIDYRLKLHGLPIRWRSRIAEWRPDREFVDEQVRGPYARWRHRHAFEPLAGGTLGRDTVQFALPFGFAGRAAGLGFVLSDVDKIFAYRAKTFAALYPGG